MLKDGIRVKIQLPEYVDVPTSSTGLVTKRVKNESPYQGQMAVIVGEDYETTERFSEEPWYFVKFENAKAIPAFVQKVLIAFPESSLIPV
jgi:hypothetical protein